MTHVIFTRINFEDKDLMKKYLSITKEILIPCLKSQTNKNFIWAILMDPNDYEYFKSELDYPFINFRILSDFIKYLRDNNVEIQTRHDCDDYMSPNYVECIQQTYNNNIKNLDKFLIQSQPIKVDYNTGVETRLKPYHNRRCSMHLTLCQKDATNHIYERQHGQMYEITPNVIMLGDTFTKWIIHGNNISVNRNRKK